MQHLKLVIASITICLIFPILGFCQMSSANKSTTLLDPKILYGVLDNGFTYYILNTSQPNALIHMELVNKIGGLHRSGPEQLGIAHFIEHLSFRSTVNFPFGLKDTMKKLVRDGVIFNASTGEVTSYSLSIPKDDSLTFNLGLLAMHDCVNSRLYKPEEVEQERAAVLNEAANSSSRAFMALMEAKYLQLNKHPLYDPKLFHAESKNISEVSAQTLKEFDEKWSRPELQGVFIVGNFNDLAVEKKVKALFSTLTSKSASKSVVTDVYRQYMVPLSGKNQLVVVGHGAERPSIHIEVWKKKKANDPLNRLNPDKVFRVKLMDELYNEMTKQRFAQLRLSDPEMRQEMNHNIARRAISSLAGIDGIGSFTDVASPNEIKTAVLFSLRENIRIQRWGFSEQEFARAKEAVKRNIAEGIQIPQPTELLQKLIAHFLYNSPVPVNTGEIYRRLLDEISLAELNTMAKTWMDSEGNIDILLSVPDKSNAQLPTQEQVLLWIDSLQRTPVPRYNEKPVVSFPGVEKQLKKEDYRISDLKEICARMVTLANGVQILFKPIPPPDSTAPMIDIELKGFRETVNNDNALRMLAAEVGAYQGAGPLSSQEIREWKQDKNRNGYLSGGTFVNENTIGFQGAVSMNNYEALLQLAYWQLTKPQMDKDAFNAIAFKDDKEKNINKSADKRFQDTIQSMTFPDISPYDEYVLNVSQIDSLAEKYKKLVAGSGPFTFIITGFFKTEEIIDLTARYLSALPYAVNSPPKVNVNRYKGNFKSDRRYDNLKITLPGDSTANVKVRMLFPVYGIQVDQDIMKLNLIQEMLNPILFARLRTQEKGVYGVLCILKPGKSKGTYLIDIDFMTARENVDRMISSVEQELARLASIGITESAFNNAVAKTRADIISQANQTYYWMNYLTKHYFNGNFNVAYTRPEEALDKLTVSDLREFADKFLDAKHYMLFKLL